MSEYTCTAIACQQELEDPGLIPHTAVPVCSEFCGGEVKRDLDADEENIVVVESA